MTRYAVQRADGRWLALGYTGQQIAALWLPPTEQAQAWTWESMTAAVMAALSVGGALELTGQWYVRAVKGGY